MVVCLVCLCVALWWTGGLSRVYPASRPLTAGIGSSPHRYRKRVDGFSSSSFFKIPLTFPALCCPHPNLSEIRQCVSWTTRMSHFQYVGCFLHSTVYKMLALQNLHISSGSNYNSTAFLSGPPLRTTTSTIARTRHDRPTWQKQLCDLTFYCFFLLNSQHSECTLHIKLTKAFKLSVKIK